MELERGWEKFRGGPADRTKYENVVRVTINRKGMIYMNSKMYQLFGKPKAVALFYNREEDAIAIRPAYERFIEHFEVVKKQAGWAIHAASFCRHYRIRVPTTERFLRPDIDNDGNMILHLRETINVGGLVRGPNKKKEN
ncbi:MAG: hypothetical protein KF881_05295 [Acidobacteria bacterium]|nr:hypothetical protein [Acidobacteriota bacterium]